MRTPKHRDLFFFIIFIVSLDHSQSQPNITGFTCSANYSCQTYALYRALSPDFLDLASIADLFMVSRRMISAPSNISSPSSALVPGQPLFVPLSCACHNTISYANLTYSIAKGDTFYHVSTHNFQNLTTYQSVMRVNPALEPTKLEVGDTVNFPIFCKCPDSSLEVNFLVSYVFQPSDDLSSVASLFGVPVQSILDVNGDNIQPLDTIFVPVTRLPQLKQSAVGASPPPSAPTVTVVDKERKGVVVGLGIGLGIAGVLLVLVIGMWVRREASMNKRGLQGLGGEEKRGQMQLGGQGLKHSEVNLMADVSECLDKYRVFKIEELKGATDGFRDSCLIQGSVYRGCIGGEVYAIKKMKWNAFEELKILQKVNHGNLVKLEGFCIDPEDGNCYLIYEYLENGSLYSLLHENKEKLSWKARLRIAIDVANGLQYIHEHTRPRVVHKDIKSSNILLDGTMRAKIANFGLAKSGCNAITMHIVGTQGYIAPEYLADGVVSTKMDVFSFGVVLLELISGKEAIDEEGDVLWVKAKGVLEEQKMTKWMDRVFSQGSCSLESVMNVMTVAVACLNRDPSKRPSMVDIVYALCKSDDLFFDISEDGLSAPLILAR